MNKIDKIKEWIRFAEMDRDTVNILNKQIKKPYEIICYHCQQSVEKYLKACLIFYGYSVYKSHDLLELNELCAKSNSNFINIRKECSQLSDYAVETRYPFHTFDITEIEVKNAIKYMNICDDFITDVLYNSISTSKGIETQNSDEESEEDEI